MEKRQSKRSNDNRYGRDCAQGSSVEEDRAGNGDRLSPSSAGECPGVFQTAGPAPFSQTSQPWD